MKRNKQGGHWGGERERGREQETEGEQAGTGQATALRTMSTGCPLGSSRLTIHPGDGALGGEEERGGR